MAVIAKRMGIALLTLWITVTLTFVLIRLQPGDPLQEWAYEFVNTQQMRYEDAYRLVQTLYDYDPNEPWGSQYARFIGHLFRGDLGESLLYKTSVNKIVAKALPWTAFVLSISLLFSFGFGTLLGMVIAWKRKTILDPLVTAYASFTGATPDYVTALVLLIFLGIRLKWFPTKGAYDAALTPGFNWIFLKDVLHHAALPILAFSFENAAGWALAMKGSAVSVLGEDYIMAARARGLKERWIMVSYMGRNAILPLVTGLAIALGGMLGGSILIETVFSYPGIGWFFNQAIIRRDYGMIQGLFLLVAAATIFANLMADLLYSRLDPRIKLEE